MKIAIVTDAWYPQINGVVNTLVHTVRCLRRQNHSVQVIAPEQFRTIPCPTYPEIHLAVDVWTVGKRLEQQSPDAVHIATEGPLGFAARRWCLARSFPFTTAYMTRFPEYIAMRFGLPPDLLTGCFRRFHGPSSGVMVSTVSLRDELASKGFRNLKLWSRGVDTELFAPGSADALEAPRPRFLYVGRVAVEKNIEAFLRLDLPGSKIVTGAGPSLDHLRASYPDALFTGAKRGEELAAIYASCDVFVFPSCTDTFGVVMLEAAACGLPVAAFPVQGPLDVVRNGMTGVLDRDLGRACIEALAIDSEACRAHALSFSWDACTEQFLDNLALEDGAAVLCGRRASQGSDGTRTGRASCL
ncbi:MAG TPA: alpha-mannosyltransferase [Synergistaceae bacterium]|nr:alpha-mannosyltransferase [Synergistaceae bacterium]